MPTPFESAQLLLTLYDQRREATMRKARDFWFSFDPKTGEELLSAMMGPDGGYVRMVISYWDMAASLVENGAIDQKMFLDCNGEFVIIFAKIEPLLPKLRETFGNPDFASHLERLVLSIPNARQRLDDTVQRMRAMVAMRAQAAGTK